MRGQDDAFSIEHAPLPLCFIGQNFMVVQQHGFAVDTTLATPEKSVRTRARTAI